jgi:hypothetical protein
VDQTVDRWVLPETMGIAGDDQYSALLFRMNQRLVSRVAGWSAALAAIGMGLVALAMWTPGAIVPAAAIAVVFLAATLAIAALRGLVFYRGVRRLWSRLPWRAVPFTAKSYNYDRRRLTGVATLDGNEIGSRWPLRGGRSSRARRRKMARYGCADRMSEVVRDSAWLARSCPARRACSSGLRTAHH